MSQLSLLLPEDPAEPGYIIDTMVLVGVGRIIYPPELKQSARRIVDDLVEKKLIVSTAEVYDEVLYGHSKKDGDEVCTLAHRYNDSGIFQAITDVDQENVAIVLAQFPTFLKVDGERPDADPWLVALAMRYPSWTIVSRDGAGKVKSGEIKLKQACEHFGIPYMTDTDFYKKHGWSV